MSVERFFLKRADLGTILPMVAAPALGAFGGKALGPRLGVSPDVGALIGGISGGTIGQLIKEKASPPPPSVPPGAPFSLDATSADIPSWALQGAQLMRSKMSGHFGDVVGGDLGGLAWPVAQGIHDKQKPMEIAKNVAGQGLGTLGGGLIGHGAGALINHLAGRGHDNPVMGPFGVPLSTLMAGLGATIGNVKGLELARR